MKAERKRAAVFTRDRMLYQKIRLELLPICDTVMCESAAFIPACDVYFIDSDDGVFDGCEGYKMSRGEDTAVDIRLPFRLGSVRTILEIPTDDGLRLCRDERAAYLYGRRIPLTEVEYSLFSELYSRGGEYATRSELVARIWGEGADEGVLNVYVHYLREKLETAGEKIIIASRGLGYKIDKKFLREEREKC